MKIFSVTDPEFKPYGRVVTGLDTAKAEILAALANTPLPAATDYVAEDAALQELPTAVEVSEHLFGGMPCQLLVQRSQHLFELPGIPPRQRVQSGYRRFCAVACQAGGNRGRQAGHRQGQGVPRPGRHTGGSLRHDAALRALPCGRSQGFRVLVALPKGTNTAKPAIKNDGGDDPQLWACNKWLLAHPDSAEAKAGAYVGLVGENVHI